MSNIVNYKDVAAKALQELKANKKLKVEVGKIRKPLADHVKISIAGRGMIVPKSLMEFYEQCDGIHIAWREKKAKNITDGIAAGEICIVPFLETFILHWKDKLWFDWMNTKTTSPVEQEQYNLAKAIKGFDVMDVLLDKTLIVSLLLPETGLSNEASITLYYWDNKGIKFPIALTPSNYIQESLKYYGLFHWQLFYIDFKKIDLSKELDQNIFGKLFFTLLKPMEEFIADYRKLFPEKDQSFLEERLKETQQFGVVEKLVYKK